LFQPINTVNHLQTFNFHNFLHFREFCYHYALSIYTVSHVRKNIQYKVLTQDNEPPGTGLLDPRGQETSVTTLTAVLELEQIIAVWALTELKKGEIKKNVHLWE
jgi:hypothetical protein